MIKQIVHISLTTFLTILVLASIARAQELTYYKTESQKLAENEEMMELMYKYDLPAEGEIDEIDYYELPVFVKQYVEESQYRDWTVAQVFEVAEPEDDSLSYVLFVEQEGYLERLTITPKGKLVEN